MTNDKFDESLKRMKTKMSKCDHLFVKLKEGEYIGGFHSSDCYDDPPVVTCLKCGLTNKYIEMSYYEKEMLFNPLYSSYCYRRKFAIEANNQVFWDQVRHASRRSGKSFDDSVFNLISDEVFNADYPGELYKMAKRIKPNGSNSDIFEIMKELNSMMTAIDRENIRNGKTADLITRYKTRVRKVNEKK